MSDTLQAMRHRIATVGELGAVVRTMKALAASNITLFDRAARASSDYSQIVELGLSVCLRPDTEVAEENPFLRRAPSAGLEDGAQTSRFQRRLYVVFGSDQGLVGLFNDSLASFAVSEILKGPNRVFAVGERMQTSLEDAPVAVAASFPVPNSVPAITPLVGRLLRAIQDEFDKGEITSVHLFHNRIVSGSSYEPVHNRILPLDRIWQSEIASRKWPTAVLPEQLDGDGATFLAFIREYLFVTMYRTCAESMASENMCRVMAMQAAQRSIGNMLDNLTLSFQRARQGAIDEELFDVVAGFESLRETVP